VSEDTSAAIAAAVAAAQHVVMMMGSPQPNQSANQSSANQSMSEDARSPLNDSVHISSK
jgi:hypothetical protein